MSVSPASPAWRIRSVSPVSSLERCLHLLRDRERVVRDEHDLGRRRLAAAAAGGRDGDDRDDDGRRSEPRLQRDVASGLTAAHRLRCVGADREQDAALERDARLGAGEDVRDAPARARMQRLAGEREVEPAVVTTPVAGPPTRERGSRARRVTRGGPARRGRRGRARRRRSRRARSPRTRRPPSRSSEPSRWSRRPSGARDHEDAPGAERARPRRARARGRWRPSPPGGARRGRRPPRPRRAPRRTPSRGRRPRRRRRGRARVRGRARRRPRSTVGASGTATAGPAPGRRRRRQVRSRTFLRWHYPGQVLRVGGASAALSARLPELPGSLAVS